MGENVNAGSSDESAGEYKIRIFRKADTEAVVDLWNRCGLTRAWNDPHKDIDRKLDNSADLFFVVPKPQSVSDADAEAGHAANMGAPEIIGSVMAGYEGHRGWINYLAVDPSQQRSGLGRLLMEHVEQELLQRGCPKINLQVRETNADVIEFYRALDYQVDAAVSLGKRLIPD